MLMEFSKQKGLLHISTLALSGLLFFNMPGVMNAAESHNNAKEQSTKLSALDKNTDKAQSFETFNPNMAQVAHIEPDTSLAKNVSKTHSTITERNRQKADTNPTSSETTVAQTNAHQTSATASKSEDASAHHQSGATSYTDLPKTGHVDHPESGAVIVIIMSIVVSTIVLIRVCRQNAQSVISNQDDL